MKGSSKQFLLSRFLFSIGIFSICLFLGNCQPPPQPNLMELSNTVQALRGQFEGFKAYVETELAKLSGSVTACCAGGGGGNPLMRPIDLEISNTKVDLNLAGDIATYTIEYKAIKDPRVIWRVNSEPATLSDEGIITKNFRNGAGQTTLRIDSSKEIVASVIVDHVTFVISFRAKPTKSAEMPLRPTNFFVDAGAHGSFNYVKSKPLNILVSSPKYYPGFTSSNDYQWSFWMANTTAQPPIMEEYPQWKEINGGVVRVGPIRTLKKIQHPTDLKIVYELMTDKGDFDGILIFSKFYTASDPASVITGLTEMRYVFVSRQDRYDPFPNGFISFVRRDPAVKPCVFNQTCSISCHAVGVVPEAIHLYKLQHDNSLLELNLPKLEVREPYMLYAHFAIKNMVEEDEGDYICSAYSRTSRTDIRTTVLASEPVEFVNSTSGIRRGPDSATVICAARGRPLPKVRIFENYAWQNEMVRTTNRYYVDKTVDRMVGGEYVASVRLTVRLGYMPQLWRVICIAENQFTLKATDFQIKNQTMAYTPASRPWGPPPPMQQMGPSPQVG